MCKGVEFEFECECEHIEDAEAIDKKCEMDHSDCTCSCTEYETCKLCIWNSVCEEVEVEE